MPLKVLVVDDATFVRDMIKRTVRQMVPDVELFEAPDGARAMGIIKSKVPDLILSDWEMPAMSGDELLQWVREQPKSASTPFVMITSRGDRNHVMAAVNAGVSDYLSKPFSADELTRKIGKQLKRMGYEPPSRVHTANANRGMASSSVDVLTGGSAVNPGTDGKAANPSSNRGPVNRNLNFKGKAYLRFPHTTCECEIRDLSLQALGGQLDRPDIIPTVFDQAAVDIISETGEVLARLNSYIHAISAAEPNVNTDRLKVIVRFVDQDPVKLEVLSSIIGKG